MARHEEFEKVVPYVYVSENRYRIKDIYFSEDACAGNHLLPRKVGLEDFLPGYELLGSDPPEEFGGGGFYAPTPEACETECYNRDYYYLNRGSKYCNAWTFIHGESGECFLKVDDVCENTLKARRQNPKAISGFLCYSGRTQCWSTSGNSKPDFCPEYRSEGIFFPAAGASQLENPSGTVS